MLVNGADVIFAVYSVPAIFAITTDTFVVYTSNIFAILGLRALYFALAAMVDRFAYLKTALAFILMFIGAKIVVADTFELVTVPPWVSLVVTLTLLAAGVAYSLWRTRSDAPARSVSNNSTLITHPARPAAHQKANSRWRFARVSSQVPATPLRVGTGPMIRCLSGRGRRQLRSLEDGTHR